jgi:hypothetical protein
MHAGATAVTRQDVGPVIDDRTATGLERPRSVVVCHAIATCLGPSGQVQPTVVCQKKQLDEQAAQRPQQPEEFLFEVEEGLRGLIVQAIGDDRVEPFMDQ